MDFDDLDDVEDQRAEEEVEEKRLAAMAEAEAEKARQEARAAKKAAAAQDAAEAAAEAVEAAAEAAAAAPVPIDRVPPRWRKVAPRELGMIDVNKGAKINDPGDYYGIVFPHTKDQLVEWGPEWLTKAFHLAGTMPKDNRVTAITDAKEFVGGGAGLKAILRVEYEKEDPALHKDLFVKLPHKAGSDRYFVSCLWNHDRPEIVFYIWLEGMTPFRIPKFYFGDISASTTNYVLITEKIPYAEVGKKDFAPGEIEPPYDKFKDWELPPPGATAYYTACCRSLGKMAGLHKAGKLGDGLDAMFPMPAVTYSEVPRNLPGHDAEARKLNALKADSLVKFVGTTAKAVFPKDISENRAWLNQWKRECLHLIEYTDEIQAYLVMNADYVALTHSNLQVDNAFFWREADGGVQVGALDWGVLGCGCVAQVLQGCITGAQFEVLDTNIDSFLLSFADSYTEHGGPQLDLDVLREMSHLSIACWATSLIRVLGNIFKFTKETDFATVSSIEDPRVMDRFHVRAQVSQIALALQMWKSKDIYTTFKRWLKTHRLPEKKA